MAPYCNATLNYVGADDRVAVETTILDARACDIDPFDETGFTLIEHQSSIVDWCDEAELSAVHRVEIAELARSLMGCDEVIAYPPIVRSPEVATRVEDYAPIELVHSDFTTDYRAMVIDPDRPYRRFIEPLLDEAGLTQRDLAEAKRLAMIQFWRSTGPRTPDFPLAVCDVRSISDTRQVKSIVAEYGGLPLEFEVSMFRAPAETPNPDRWYTYPAMRIDEALMFRTYDSDRERDGLPVWTPHSAFADPHVDRGPSNRRQSVEMRALCLWAA